jgi:hypothetical protein
MAPLYTTFSDRLPMISAPSELADAPDALIAVADQSVKDAAGFAGIDAASLWALQRQTDGDMIREATRCLEQACQTVLVSRVENSALRDLVQRLPPFDRTNGQWRMLVELSVIPERLAEAVWKFGELSAAIAVRSSERRFRLKDLPVAHYVRLGRTLLGSLLGDRTERAVADDALALRREHSAAAFVWLLSLNILGELRAIVADPTGDATRSSHASERVTRAVAASEAEWQGLRAWLAGRARAESPMPVA